jgi:hypothetical protein
MLYLATVDLMEAPVLVVKFNPTEPVHLVHECLNDPILKKEFLGNPGVKFECLQIPDRTIPYKTLNLLCRGSGAEAKAKLLTYLTKELITLFVYLPNCSLEGETEESFTPVNHTKSKGIFARLNVTIFRLLRCFCRLPSAAAHEGMGRMRGALVGGRAAACSRVWRPQTGGWVERASGGRWWATPL